MPVIVPVAEVWVRLPARYTRPLVPGLASVVVLAALPAMIEPCHWASPVTVTSVAVGKFHIRFGRSSVSWSPAWPVPLLVLTVTSLPVMLTITVAPAGMPAKTMARRPPFVPMLRS
nr:hypothetical protein RKE32_08975 [Streptomyces sp. Li-HN-5-13]